MPEQYKILDCPKGRIYTVFQVLKESNDKLTYSTVKYNTPHKFFYNTTDVLS